MATTTTSRRGPCTPSTRLSSMSLVADGPETRTIGRPSRALGSSAAMSSGTVSTICVGADHADVEVGNEAERATSLTGTPVERDRARLGAAGGAGRERAVERVELARVERRVLDELEPGRSQARLEVGGDTDARGARARRGRPRRPPAGRR